MIIINHDTVKEMDSMDWYNVLGFLNSNMTQFINKKEIHVQIELSQNFAFFQKNATNDGVYTIFTGETDITKLGHIDQYNGSR